MALTLVSTTTVGSGGAASIEFTNIPQTGKDLLLLISGRNDFGAASPQEIYFSLNGTATATERNLYAYDTGQPVFSGTDGGIRMPTPTQTSNTFGSTSYYLSNYTSSSNKSVSVDVTSENNSSNGIHVGIVARRQSVTSAITSITLTAFGNFVQHSTASLYIIS